MGDSLPTPLLNRRSILKTGLLLGAAQVTSPFIITARGEESIRIGMVDPLTGAYAAVAQSEVEGAKLAIEHINAKRGILGRKAELLVEDAFMGDGRAQATVADIRRALRLFRVACIVSWLTLLAIVLIARA